MDTGRLKVDFSENDHSKIEGTISSSKGASYCIQSHFVSQAA